MLQLNTRIIQSNLTTSHPRPVANKQSSDDNHTDTKVDQCEHQPTTTSNSRYNAAYRPASPQPQWHLQHKWRTLWHHRWNLTSYRPTKYTFSTHVLHIFVNEISSPTYTTLMLVLYLYLYYVVFSSDFVSNLTMAIRAKTCSWDILYI